VTDKRAAVVAALLVLRQRQESGGEHPDVIAIRARILEEAPHPNADPTLALV